MKKLLLAVLAMACLISADAQLKTPAASTGQTVKQEFGLGSIELSYSRPNIRKRKIFGDIVPFDSVWRTGANTATTLTFTDDVIIAGITVPAGKYGLLSIPHKKTWDIIISKQTNVTSPSAYKKEMDVLRIAVDVSKVKKAVESFTISFANVMASSVDLQICWDKSMVTLPILTDVDSKVMAAIEQNMKSAKPEYFAAATYYMQNGKDLNQALTWFNKAVEAQPDAFWIQHQWANCLAKLGKTQEAKAAANRSKELAAKAGNNDYVKLNEKLLKQLDK
ncbi:MAG: DUF2911 domain-containing protein [Chitinophagaceae bacterium]|nr:MAG: DUF2911 domain-containing protein [Chitinophagaceae bacterium]